ncbi:MAG: excisionase family DNA-binding protein [Desulfuromonadaceae bacterium]
MKPTRKTITAPSAAELLGCSKETAYRLYRDGIIEGYRIGTRQGIRLYLDSVQAHEENRYAE